MAIIIARYLPLWLLLAGILLLLLTGRPHFRDATLSAKQDKFRSLRTVSPVLNTLIAISVIGKPFLEHLRKNDWQSDLFGSSLLAVVVPVLLVSLYAMLGAVIYFFFRAIQNINFFSRRRVRSPSSAFLMVVPITNFIVIPYLEYFTYQRSRALALPQEASAPRAAVLAISAFGLLAISIACGLPGDDLSEPTIYEPMAFFVIGVSTGLASGILSTRIVEGTFRAQEEYARRIGALLTSPTPAALKAENRRLEALKSACVGILVALALFAALFPTLTSHALQPVSQLLIGS
jgi:hypothetical protein